MTEELKYKLKGTSGQLDSIRFVLAAPLEPLVRCVKN